MCIRVRYMVATAEIRFLQNGRPNGQCDNRTGQVCVCVHVCVCVCVVVGTLITYLMVRVIISCNALLYYHFLYA